MQQCVICRMINGRLKERRDGVEVRVGPNNPLVFDAGEGRVLLVFILPEPQSWFFFFFFLVEKKIRSARELF